MNNNTILVIDDEIQIRELLARIRASLRLGEKVNNNPVFKVGDLSVNMINHIAKKKEELLDLTPTEFSLLSLFIKIRDAY